MFRLVVINLNPVSHGSWWCIILGDVSFKKSPGNIMFMSIYAVCGLLQRPRVSILVKKTSNFTKANSLDSQKFKVSYII